MRLGPLNDPTPEQAELAERIARRRGGVPGPFQVLLRSPRLGGLVEELGSYCTGAAALPPRLRELALLVAARRFDAQHSWIAHAGKAADCGIDRAAVRRLARGERPDFPDTDDELLYQFASQVLDSHFVSDEVFAAALGRFGEQGLVDLICCLGNFVLMAMLLNTFQVDLPPGSQPPFPDVDGFGRRTTSDRNQRLT
jgi:4-carboxymuconolactone decarboxylase